MLGTKIRSWMEAHIVRPRKKQHRKDAATKKRSENDADKETVEASPATTRPASHMSSESAASNISSAVISDNNTNTVNENATKFMLTSDQVRNQYQRQQNSNNLSSPESAYSTGYSTDGTSPGTSFPAATSAPEYYINIRTGTRYFHSSSDVPSHLLHPAGVQQPQSQPTSLSSTAAFTNGIEPGISNGHVASPTLTSPRQRNRIRTNPWVTTNTAGCVCSPMHASVASRPMVPIRPPLQVTGRTPTIAATVSPMRRKWSCSDKKQRCMKCGTCSRFEAFSSSSSSSISMSSVHRAATRPSIASDDEDDQTLNEMMGKYDESYIYEKETDILSDSDPTDCDEEYDDTDVDAGRDGGDERDPLTDEDDFDFIDNGSLELNIIDDSGGNFVNMGHCTYHNFQVEQSMNHRRESGKGSVGFRRSVSGTPTSRRHRPSERRSRHASFKKWRDRHPSGASFAEQTKGSQPLPSIPARGVFLNYADGSRSAGNTPVSVRRRRAVLSEQMNSSMCRSVDKQRRNSMSHPRPCLKDTADLMKPLDIDKDADMKYRELIIEAEHILMAMRTISPPVSGSPARRAATGPANKRVELLRNEECGGGSSGVNNNISNSMDSHKAAHIDSGTLKFSPKKNHIVNFIKTKLPIQAPPVVPAREKLSKMASSSPRRAPVLTFRPAHANLHRHCPQSEPVKRKVYAANMAESLLQRQSSGLLAAANGSQSITGKSVFQKQTHHLSPVKSRQKDTNGLEYIYHSSGSNQQPALAYTATKHV